MKSKKMAECVRPLARLEKLTAPVIALKELPLPSHAFGTFLAKIKRFSGRRLLARSSA
ncbi:MAG TPA: hypothetical protein VGC66_07305 [Pyrinomonadaceae bacterium]